MPREVEPKGTIILQRKHLANLSSNIFNDKKKEKFNTQIIEDHKMIESIRQSSAPKKTLFPQNFLDNNEKSDKKLVESISKKINTAKDELMKVEERTSSFSKLKQQMQPTENACINTKSKYKEVYTKSTANFDIITNQGTDERKALTKLQKLYDNVSKNEKELKMVFDPDSTNIDEIKKNFNKNGINVYDIKDLSQWNKSEKCDSIYKVKLSKAASTFNLRELKLKSIEAVESNLKRDSTEKGKLFPAKTDWENVGRLKTRFIDKAKEESNSYFKKSILDK